MNWSWNWYGMCERGRNFLSSFHLFSLFTLRINYENAVDNVLVLAWRTYWSGGKSGGEAKLAKLSALAVKLINILLSIGTLFMFIVYALIVLMSMGKNCFFVSFSFLLVNFLNLLTFSFIVNTYVYTFVVRSFAQQLAINFRRFTLLCEAM